MIFFVVIKTWRWIFWYY